MATDTEQASSEEFKYERDGDDRPAQVTAPETIGFFHADLKEHRGQAYKRWSITILGLGVYILMVLSLYWGALFNVYEKLPSLTVWIVDFDAKVAPFNTTTPIVGPFITNAFEKLTPQTVDKLGWTVKSAADFNYDPMVVREELYNEKAWTAIIVNANATTLLLEAVNNGNSSYDPTGAAQILYNSARDQTTMSAYIFPALIDVMFPIIGEFGEEWSSILAKNASTQNVFRTPQAVNPGIGFSFIDLRPFTPPTGTPAISIGLIYLIIISFFSFSFLMPVHGIFMGTETHAPVNGTHVIIWRIMSSIVAYFFLSLFYSLVSLAFQIPFSNHSASHTEGALNANAYGKGTFVVYWMLNWVGMTSLGLPSENMAMILGFPYASLWLVFWVITNVATSFNDIGLMSDFYRWGYAWPLNRIVHASRTLIFDTKSAIGEDFGILFAWCAISILFFPFATWIMRWKNMRAQRKK
ncbi:conserved hypothetical protein [Talaromyces stipitatus ATCC 10500]|uniref:DUF3533 domain-containing protein n=1 Tax=Talaromyces stipitatus (strain ATCC 10500 / CBS 375.48 / QM 6759 / NRRL 1006) TaxID=441959 RepID=B8MPA8_TALSN|nr:uncharacterized protein TSTA_105580 [Talaromyces stipitatus ATCC 10500]EED14347.1 conserved hypothetical protein [Talaromyces stipitatus ATCC 10500]